MADSSSVAARPARRCAPAVERLRTRARSVRVRWPAGMQAGAQAGAQAGVQAGALAFQCNQHTPGRAGGGAGLLPLLERPKPMMCSRVYLRSS